MSLSLSSDAAAAVPASQVVTLRQAAVDYVARATGMTLDGSEESLAIVDHYIEKVRAGGDATRKPEVLRLVAVALGVYLGELCVTRFGGHWRIVDGPQAEPAEVSAIAGWRVEIEAAPIRIDPIAMAIAALLQKDAGDDDDEETPDAPGFTLLPTEMALNEPLHAALSRLAPVSAEYYYSLTGRFETLTYVVDLLTDLRHQRQQAAAGNEASDGPDESDEVSDDDRPEAAAKAPPARP